MNDDKHSQEIDRLYFEDMDRRNNVPPTDRIAGLPPGPAVSQPVGEQTISSGDSNAATTAEDTQTSAAVVNEPPTGTPTLTTRVERVRADIQRAIELAERATPGPWMVKPTSREDSSLLVRGTDTNA